MVGNFSETQGDGGSSTSMDIAYNTACGSGSARRDKIEARMSAIENHFARYVKIELREDAPESSDIDDDTPDDEISPEESED